MDCFLSAKRFRALRAPATAASFRTRWPLSTAVPGERTG
jgi:hypothetical protein